MYIITFDNKGNFKSKHTFIDDPDGTHPIRKLFLNPKQRPIISEESKIFLREKLLKEGIYK